MSLYNKHRPKTLKRVFGNTEVIESLTGFLQDIETCPQVFLFSGPTGTGKTTLARIIRNKIGIEDIDYTEINSSQFTGVDTVRDIIQKVPYKPIASKYKLYVLDEVHRLSKQAQDAILKTLEDTPKHCFFILCTTEPNSLAKALRGRCTQYTMNLLNDNDMTKLLNKICQKEKVVITENVIDSIVDVSLGHPRNAIQLLETVIATPENKRLEISQLNQVFENKTIDLCRALLTGKAWGTVSTILKDLKKEDPESIRRAVLGYAQNTLLNKNTVDVNICRILEEFAEPTYNSGFAQITLACAAVLMN